MTLTIVIGSSGSGKTTFLNDVYKAHHCIYIRQYHLLRPYTKVTKIPNFDPTRLPFWDTYVKEGTSDNIKVGGTMAGSFTPGLSGGQRKILLFEIIYQRTEAMSDLLILLDEPFAGVTDDFVHFVSGRLERMRARHNVVLVTNDHIAALTSMADSSIKVSSIDRSKVQLDEKGFYDREKMLHALSDGNDYVYEDSAEDLRFFFNVEVLSDDAIKGVSIFSVICSVCFLLSFWDTGEESQALVLVASQFISYLSLNPYLLTLVDWRNSMLEEAEALIHASKKTNSFLKSCMALWLLVVLTTISYGLVNVVVDGLSGVNFWLAMVFDIAAITFPLVAISIYTMLPFSTVQILGSIPSLLMIFFSTTFSPGSGVPGLKELRYLFPRFYFWCMVPAVEDSMEGCPSTDGLSVAALILSAFLPLSVFILVRGITLVKKKVKKREMTSTKQAFKADNEFSMIQGELYESRRRIKRPSSKSLRKLFLHDDVEDTNSDLDDMNLFPVDDMEEHDHGDTERSVSLESNDEDDFADMA